MKMGYALCAFLLFLVEIRAQDACGTTTQNCGEGWVAKAGVDAIQCDAFMSCDLSNDRTNQVEGVDLSKCCERCDVANEDVKWKLVKEWMPNTCQAMACYGEESPPWSPNNAPSMAELDLANVGRCKCMDTHPLYISTTGQCVNPGGPPPIAGEEEDAEAEEEEEAGEANGGCPMRRVIANGNEKYQFKIPKDTGIDWVDTPAGTKVWKYQANPHTGTNFCELDGSSCGNGHFPSEPEYTWASGDRLKLKCEDGFYFIDTYFSHLANIENPTEADIVTSDGFEIRCESSKWWHYDNDPHWFYHSQDSALGEAREVPKYNYQCTPCEGRALEGNDATTDAINEHVCRQSIISGQCVSYRWNNNQCELSDLTPEEAIAEARARSSFPWWGGLIIGVVVLSIAGAGLYYWCVAKGRQAAVVANLPSNPASRKQVDLEGAITH